MIDATSSRFDSFINKSSKYGQCETHHKKLQLVCCNMMCSMQGLMCLDCFMEGHIDCKKQVIKLKDFEQKVAENAKLREESRKQYLNQFTTQINQLNQASCKLNRIVTILNKQLSDAIMEVDQFIETDNHSSSSYFDNREVIKQLALHSKHKDVTQIIAKYQKVQSQSGDITKQLEQITKKYGETSLLRLDMSKLVKINSIDELQYIDRSTQRIRIQFGDVTEESVHQFRQLLLRFSNLDVMQLSVARSNASTLHLNQIISSFRDVRSLTKFHLNISSSNADNQTLELFFNIISLMKLTEMGISIDNTRIDQTQLLVLFEIHTAVIRQIHTIILTNKYNQISASLINKLMEKYTNIELQ